MSPLRRGRRPRLLTTAAVAVAAAILTVTPAAASPRTAQVFATVPSPGHPEGVVVDPDGTVYVGTHQDAGGGPGLASHVFAYDQRGVLKRDYVIQGQATSGQGITGMAQDRRGVLHILDRHPARLVTLDPRTGAQRTSATFRDVLPCAPGQTRDCSATAADQPAYPDDLVFGPDGATYVTDIAQALIWRIPPGGGTPQVWYTNPVLESVFGPNGIRFADSRTLVFAQSTDVLDPSEILTGAGRIYTLPINAKGAPGDLRVLWQGQSGEAPDGLAIGRSGRIYVAMALGNALMVLSPGGRELSRTPATANDNGQLPVPFDNPAGVAFQGNSVLITNQAFLGGPTAHQVVLKVAVGEPGKPLYKP